MSEELDGAKSEREAFYDEHIAPALLEIARKCHERGMPFVATVEYEPDSFGTTADAPADRSLPIDWAYVSARSMGNADVLIGHLVNQAKVRGHGSAYLMQLGVPTSPSPARPEGHPPPMSDLERDAIRAEAFDDLAAIFERDTFEGSATAALIARNAASMTRKASPQVIDAVLNPSSSPPPSPAPAST